MGASPAELATASTEPRSLLALGPVRRARRRILQLADHRGAHTLSLPPHPWGLAYGARHRTTGPRSSPALGLVRRARRRILQLVGRRGAHRIHGGLACAARRPLGPFAGLAGSSSAAWAAGRQQRLGGLGARKR
nr:unnamed protein product [Digitaria exilis]